MPRILHEDKYIEARDVARYGGAGVPPWSQAWGRDSSESSWWPGSPRDPRAPSPKEMRGTPSGPPPAKGTVRDRAKRIGWRTK
ncbi:hypothetical protein CRENBAI_012103, partial [Crenichthys baileyi]